MPMAERSITENRHNGRVSFTPGEKRLSSCIEQRDRPKDKQTL